MRITSKFILILAIFGVVSFGGVKQVRAGEFVAFEQTATTSNSTLTVGLCHYQSFIASTSNFTKLSIWASTGHTVVMGIANYINCVNPETTPYNFYASTSVTTVGNNWTTATFATTSLNVGQTYFIKICHNSAGTMTLYRSTTDVLTNSIWAYPTTFCGGRNTSDLAFRIYTDIDTSTPPTIISTGLGINIASNTPEIAGNLVLFIEKYFVNMWPFTLAIAIVIGFGVMFIKFFDKVIK